jgi:hypothetical protein
MKKWHVTILMNDSQIKILIVVFLILFGSCKKDDSSDEETKASGKIRFEFYHNVDGQPLLIDTLIYTNNAGNVYMVNEIQYFISDITLHGSPAYIIDAWKDIHYIDTDLPETQAWDVFDDIPAGYYDKISFTFGINEQKNQSLMFVNPPESFMFWPEYLGGGYHYLKLNGKWRDTLQVVVPFNFHLGIGQVYDTSGTITAFIQNYFTVDLPQSAITINPGQTTTIGIIMNIENWFKEPNTYDHNVWGGDIMQTQAAMQAGCENGDNVFSIKN